MSPLPSSGMASFAEILAKKPKVQTRQALMVIGLQNDFITSAGHLPVDTTSGFLDRIHSLIPRLRELNGNIIWVQTLYEADRLANTSSTGEGDALVIAGLVDGEETGSQAGDDESIKDLPVSIPQAQSRSAKHKQRALDLFKRVSSRRKALPVEEAKIIIEEDEELFLLKRTKKGAACMPDTVGVQFTKDIDDKITTPRDAVIKTTNYSAFLGTNLLLTLRARLITEIYVCGCLSNVSVLATVIDGARHGIKINVIQDALGFRKQARHDLALKRMEDFFDAYMVTTADVLAKEHFEVVVPAKEDVKHDAEVTKRSKDDLEVLVGNLTLQEKTDTTTTPSNSYSTKTADDQPVPSKISSSGTPDIVSARHVDSDEEFTAAAAQYRRTNGGGQRPAENNESKLVQSKTRMRKKKKKRPVTDTSMEPGVSNGNSKEADSHSQPPVTTPDGSMLQQEEALSVQAHGGILHKDEAESRPPNTNIQEATMSSKDSPVDKTSPAPTKAPISGPAADLTTIEVDPSPTSLVPEPSSTSPTPNTISAEVGTILPTQSQTVTTTKASKLRSLANFTVLGPGDTIADGDSRIVHDFIPSNYYHPSHPAQPLADTIFQQLYNEVRWQKMLHRQGEVPRLVCCQGEFGDDGSKPIYRHPADQTLPLLHFSSKVQWIRRAAENLVGHPLNHVLIQLYRSGNDYISEHSDKTLDIATGSSIVNVSFGAQRVMRLRTKKGSMTRANGDEDSSRETQRVAMPHNSMFVLGFRSNERWLHGIMADKRIEAERSDVETAYSGVRISLTFRQIATFLDARETVIWGQGATSKDQRGAADIVNNDEEEAERMIRAFSRENQSNDFDRDKWYGEGFDILHLHEAPEQLPILFASSNVLEMKQVQLALWESKINHKVLEAPDLEKGLVTEQRLVFRDNDTHFTEVEGLSSVLHYIDRYHSFCADKPVTSAAYALLAMFTQRANFLPERIASLTSPSLATNDLELTASLHVLSEQLKDHGGPFIAGKRFSIADCVLWPVLDECVENWVDWDETRWPDLMEYYRLAWKKKACLKKLRLELPVAKEKV
ncbi:hypothetical protein C7974DRAFT_392504 [Boeremia exigua]|uniref:uncharacterized protein n=1 Tax=Boeremia exigua TaxID=749465 RepID=UPI001E8D7AC6|nr:uncharacterized protein C7974DRAFT_392504 [Boeremia exigua]KAH6633311.1 hypothetical protein C7974DRAFT_392504 [Boeremia exigua]